MDRGRRWVGCFGLIRARGRGSREARPPLPGIWGQAPGQARWWCIVTEPVRAMVGCWVGGWVLWCWGVGVLGGVCRWSGRFVLDPCGGGVRRRHIPDRRIRCWFVRDSLGRVIVTYYGLR